MSTEDNETFARETNVQIGKNLRAARERAGLSQKQLAERAQSFGAKDVYQTTIARIESGERAMRAVEAIAFSAILQAPLDLLFSLEAAAVTASMTMLRDASRELVDSSEKYVKAMYVAAVNLDREEEVPSKVSEWFLNSLSAQTPALLAGSNALGAVEAAVKRDELDTEGVYLAHVIALLQRDDSELERLRINGDASS